MIKWLIHKKKEEGKKVLLIIAGYTVQSCYLKPTEFKITRV